MLDLLSLIFYLLSSISYRARSIARFRPSPLNLLASRTVDLGLVIFSLPTAGFLPSISSLLPPISYLLSTIVGLASSICHVRVSASAVSYLLRSMFCVLSGVSYLLSRIFYLLCPTLSAESCIIARLQSLLGFPSSPLCHFLSSMFKHQSSISFNLLSSFSHDVFYARAISSPLHPMLYRLSPIPNLLGSIAYLRSFLFYAPYPQSCISSNLLSFVFYLPPLFACALVAYALRSLPVLSSTPCPLSCVSTICSLLSVMFYLLSSNLYPLSRILDVLPATSCTSSSTLLCRLSRRPSHLFDLRSPIFFCYPATFYILWSLSPPLSCIPYHFNRNILKCVASELVAYTIRSPPV